MSIRAHSPRRSEIMDRLDLPVPEVERALRDLRRVNRVTLAHGALVRSLLPRLARGVGTPRVVDLGTGSGEAGEVLARHAALSGLDLRLIGVDRRLAHLEVGRRLGTRQLRVVADGASLPFRDGGVDWTFSTLLLHHFDRLACREILGESARVSKRGVLAVDLRRSRLASFLVRLLFPLLGMGHVASHDGKVSIDQAWRIEEIAAIAGDLPVLELRRRLPFRFSLLVAPIGSAAGSVAVSESPSGPVPRGGSTRAASLSCRERPGSGTTGCSEPR